MEQILSYISDLALIHPILPVFANISLIIMICLIIYIPISLFAWIIEVAFRNFVNLLVKNLRQFSEFLTSKILEFYHAIANLKKS